MILDAWDYGLIFVGLGLVGYLIVMLWGTFKFKHIVIIREVMRDKLFVLQDKAKIIKIDGVDFWKLKKAKHILSCPPSKALDVSRKGKYFVEAYRSEDGEYCWITDSVAKGNFFQPLTTNQRQIYISQIKKAQMKQGLSWEQYAPLIASGMILIMVMGIMFGFWNDITKPSLDALKLNNAREQLEKEQLEILRDIKFGIQRIGVDLDIDPVAVVVPPN